MNGDTAGPRYSHEMESLEGDLAARTAEEWLGASVHWYRRALTASTIDDSKGYCVGMSRACADLARTVKAVRS